MAFLVANQGSVRVFRFYATPVGLIISLVIPAMTAQLKEGVAQQS
jgi:hypothetical protein